MLASLAAVTDATPQPATTAGRPGVPRSGLAVALFVALAITGGLALALGSGSHRSGSPTRGAPARASRPQPRAPSASGTPAAKPVPSGRPGVVEVRDPQESSSYPAPASVHHAAAATPSKAGEAIVAAGAPSDAEVRAELQQMQAAERSAREAQ